MRGFGQEWWSPGLSDPDGCFALARCLRSLFFSHALRARRALAQQKPHKVIQCGPALAERSRFPSKPTSSIFCRRSRGVQTGLTLGRQLLLGATQCGYCTFEDFGFSPHVDLTIYTRAKQHPVFKPSRCNFRKEASRQYPGWQPYRSTNGV